MSRKNLGTTRGNRGGASRGKRDFTFNFTQEQLGSLTIHAPISIKQEKYLNDQENDIIVWGGAAGSSKTYISLINILLKAYTDPYYVASIARRSQRQMKSAGSLWTTGCKMYSPLGIGSNSLELSWSFPNKAEVKCHHLDNNQDDWQGTQCTEFLVDEAQQCSEDDIWYLTSRLRSQSNKKHQLRLTCNPLNTSFLADWLTKGGYLLESGLPNMEMDGVTTYMVQVAGEFYWFPSIAEVRSTYGAEVARSALKFVYYAANVYDNPYIRKHNPSYITKLENLKTVERERLLEGNWYARVENDGYIDSDWFIPIPRREIRLDLPQIRCWDFASTKPHEANKDPDWTRGVKASYDKDSGEFFILDMVGVRDRPAIVHNLLMQTAQADGRDVYQGIPLDAGQAGRVATDAKRAELLSIGMRVVTSAARKSKLERAEPFLIALQEGKVFLAEGVFTSEHFKELENFDGKRNNGFHDDIIDCLADCYNQLTSSNLIPTLRIRNESRVGGRRFNNLGGNTLL